MEKVVVITGGSCGIGKTIANTFISKGDTVIILSRSVSKFKDFLKTHSGHSRKIYHYKLDICNYDEVVSVFKRMQKVHDRIDVLINNAGILGPAATFDELDICQWVNNLNVNLIGAAQTMHVVLKVMKEQNYGRIINISGGGAVKPLPSLSAYCASKSGLVRLTETLACEYQQYNIRINAVAPGFVVTGIHDEILNGGANVNNEIINDFSERISSGGDNPQLTADLCLFLTSESANDINGRLISAVYDDWKSINSSIAADKTLYTLRRVDNHFVINRAPKS